MKLIHCADLHLDSKMSANLDKERTKERKGEILHTFERMVAYAAEHAVEAILIAGDLFDVKNISATVRNTVLLNVANHPEITFYYLKGNHDNDNFFFRVGGNSWQSEIVWPAVDDLRGVRGRDYHLGNRIVGGERALGVYVAGA